MRIRFLPAFLLLLTGACGDTVTRIPIPHTPIGTDQTTTNAPVTRSTSDQSTYRISANETVSVRKVDENTTVKTYTLGGPPPALNYAATSQGRVPVYSVSRFRTSAEAASDATRLKKMPGIPVNYGEYSGELRRMVLNGSDYGVIKPLNKVPGPLSRKYPAWQAAMFQIAIAETGCQPRQGRGGGLVRGLTGNAFVVPLNC